MADQNAIAAIARNLYRGYLKDTTGTPGQWADLDQEGRKLWRAMAKRAIKRIEGLRLEASQAPGDPSLPPEDGR